MNLFSPPSGGEPRHAQAADRIVGSGDMSDLVRAFDWATTPLKSIDKWSDPLLSNVNQALLSPIPNILCWGADLIMFYNEAAIDALQGRHPQALGSSYREVYKEVWHLVGPDIEDCYHNGATVARENLLVPLIRGGAIEDAWFTYYLIPVFEAGQIAGVYNPYQNNTANVLAHRALVETKRQLQQVLDATTDAVFSLDRDWRFTYLNKNAKRLLSPYGDLLGRNLWEAFPDTQHKNSPFVREYSRTMNEGLPGEFETYYPVPEGWFQVLSRPSADGITVFFRDITASKRAAGALIESEKLAAVGRLAASIAHEINNPLEAATNLIYLARTSDSIESIHQQLDAADHELRRAAEITSQTLRFHKQASKPTEIAPRDLLENVLTIYQGRLSSAGVRLEQRSRVVRTLHCFEGEVRQVLSNLIGNAIDAMSAGRKRLLVRLRDGHEWSTGRAGVVFTVADTGSGMPAGTLARIFEAFYTTKGFTGTGLGLWVSKEIVERHSGSLRVRSSEQDGRSGTVFTFFLPFEAVNR